MEYYEQMQADMASFISYRKSAGYNTDNYERVLTNLFIFCKDGFPNATCLTKEMIDSFILEAKDVSINTQAVYISILRKYTRYLCFLGRSAYIPDDDYSLRRTTYIPHIPDRDELRSFFETVDTYPSHSKALPAGLLLPVIFRMQYCCGMRPGEPLRLRQNDVSLTDGDIYICETKTSMDRHIVMSNDLLRLCQKYNDLAGPREWFFQCKDGNPIKVQWMTRMFRKCWENSNGCGNVRTRPYDLRHAFATHTLMRWIDNGDDIMTLLPYLSTYMGHKKISSTFYYIHLLPERLRKSSGINWETLDSIYREDPHEKV